MDEDDRKKKLLAGRERLAKFQKQKTSPDKKVKKKKKKKASTEQVDDGLGVANGDSDISTPGPLSDDSSYDQDHQVDSSFASDFSSPLHSEADQSFDGESVDEDSDSRYDVASPVHNASSDRILELEETLEGKELALRMMQQELDDATKAMEEAQDHALSVQADAQAAAGATPPPNNIDAHQQAGDNHHWQSASIQPEPLTSEREAEYNAAIEQYNLKIIEFQTALAQRDDIIKQLSDNMQGALQSRDEVQREASNQAENLSHQIQSLQSQLRTAGETLQSQGKTQVNELAEELTKAHDQVVNLRQTVADKEALMHELANRYSKKSEELFDLKEEKEAVVREHAGEVATLKHQVSELRGDGGALPKEELIEVLRAELDESYGNQMMLMKQQLMENHHQETELLQQRCNELQVLARSNAGAADVEVGALKNQLDEQGKAFQMKADEAEVLKEQLQKLVTEFSRQNEEIEQKHAADNDILRRELYAESKVKMDELESEKQREREYQADVVSDLTDKLNQALNDSKELTEIRDTYEGQITRLMKQLEETQRDSETAADLNAENEQERKKHADEMEELKEQLNRIDEDNRELTQIREAYEGQIARLSSELENKPNFDAESDYNGKEKDEQLAEYEAQVQELERKLEESKASGPSMDKLQEIREGLAAQIKMDYDDLMEDLKYDHEGQLKRLKVQLDVEYKDNLRDATKAVEDQLEQSIKKVQTEKEREFVLELQNVRAELQEQYDEKLRQELDKGRSETPSEEPVAFGMVNEEASQGGGVLTELKKDLMNKLEIEVQDLSEVRDDLLEQLEVATRDQETVREELAAATFEKNNLSAEVEQLKDELLGIHFQADTSTDSPFYDNERDELNDKMQVMNSKLQSQEQDHEIEVSGYIAKMEALKQEIAKATQVHDQERGELDNKILELESQLKEKVDDVPSEELQGLGERNASLVSEIERMQRDLSDAKSFIEEHGQRAVDLDSRNQALEEQVEQLQKQLELSGHEMEGLQEAMTSLREVQMMEMQQLSEEKPRLESDLAEANDEIERMKNAQSKDTSEEATAELEDKLRELEEEKRRADELLEKAVQELERMREEVEQSEERIRDLEGEVCRQADERNELDDKMSTLEKERDQLLTEKEELQHQLETEEKERESQVGELESRIASFIDREDDTADADGVRQERDSALGTLDSLSSQYRTMDARNKELELHVENLEEQLTRQQSMQIVRDVEIMAQRETFEEAVANYDRTIGELRAEKEEIRMELERQGTPDKPSHLIPVEEEMIVAGTVAPVASVAAAPSPGEGEDTSDGRDFTSLPSDLETTVETFRTENKDLKAKLAEASEETDFLLHREHQLKQELSALKVLLQEGEEEKEALEDLIEEEKEQINELKMVDEDLERENQQLKEVIDHQPELLEDQAAVIAGLEDKIGKLKKELQENQELYERENVLLKEALQEERDTTARLLNEGESPTSRDALLQEIIDLKKRLAHKDQTEHEILTEKSLQIGLLQETNAKLEEEKYDLSTKISDLEKRMQASEAISQEVQDTFGRQYLELQSEQSALKDQLEKQKTTSNGQPLDEQALREEALRCAKDMLLQKLEEKEAVEQQMLDEKMELQKQLGNQQSLEELLHEKDTLEQELARQKRSLQSEVKELEQKLQDQARKLQNEKSNLECELQQKDFELRKWEASFREQQLEYRNREAFVRRKHDNQVGSMMTDSDKEMVARLEGMRLILERQHAEAVSRLRRDLEQEFSSREGRQTEKHLSDISLLKSRHQSQLEDMKAEFESRIEGAKEELEEERKKQLGTVKTVHERVMEQDQAEHVKTLQDLTDQHEWEMEALKGELDLRQRAIFEEMKTKIEENNLKEKESIRQQSETKARKEVEAIKSSLEQVYTSQTESLRADLAHEKAQALNELRQALMLANDEALKRMEESWAAKLEEERKDLAYRTDEAEQNTHQLISQLQRRLSLEHKQVVQTLAEQWDQEAVERLETVRTEMEAKYTQELQEEKKEAEERREEDMERTKEHVEGEYKSDVEILLKEREMLVEHAEEMRQNLDRVHHKELAELRANLKAEYDQYVRAKEEMEIARSQSEASLIEDLSLLRIAHQDLQQQYRADVASLKAQLEQAGVPDPDQLAEENKELQTALTKLRAKLQEEHTEELNQLRLYFEKQVEETDERWKAEMAELKNLYESPEGNAGKDLDERDAKRKDYSHAMMTLTHLSDSDSSPPRSPPKFLEVEAELKQELRAQLEHEYQKDLRNLRLELESEHEAQMARIKMEYDLQREEDMLQLEDRLNAKHTQDANDLELDYLNQFEELRNQLEGDHSKEIIRLQLQGASESARAVEEEVTRMTTEHREAMEESEESHAQENQEMRQQMSSELASAVAEEMEGLRETLQKEHMEEMESLRQQYESSVLTDSSKEEANRHAEEVKQLEGEWQQERELLVKASKNEIVDEVAKIVSDATIERALLQVEVDTQSNMIGICLEQLDKLKNSEAESLQGAVEEVEQLRRELEDTKERLHQLQESIKNGEAPEIQELKETLMRDYDNRLELITTTMNEEMDQLVRTTQVEARADLEKMQEDFAVQHQALMDRFVEDQEKALGELKVVHEEDLARTKEELQTELTQQQMKDLEDLRGSLTKAKEEELEMLRKSHAQELEELRLDLMKLTDEERDKLEEKMMEERRGVEEVEQKMREMEERHERDKEEFKEELVASHMQKFREVTAELEETHKQEMEASNTFLQAELDSDFTQRLEALQDQLQESTQQLQESDQQHEDEMSSLKQSLEMKLTQMEEDHADQLAALGSSQDADVETAKGDLEEVHRKEIIDLQNKLEAQKQKDIEDLQMAFEEAKKLLTDNHREMLSQIEAEKEEKVKEMEREKEEAMDALKEEMNRNAEQEKGEKDQMIKEKDDLVQENEQLKGKNAELLESLAKRESVIGRSERENEEGSTLLAMLRSDLDRLGTERDGLQQTNNHLLRVLTQVVHTTMASENAINRRLGGGSRPSPSRQQEMDRRGDGRPSSPRIDLLRGAVGGDSSSDGDVLHDTSVASMFSDEGLELSQHINESMFVGPELDSEGEEMVTGATTRLHSAVERLLDQFSDSSTQSDQRRPVQAEGYASSASSREEDSLSRSAGAGAPGDRDDLLRRLHAEIREKERLAVELHKSDGLLDGITAEKMDVEDALQQARERHHGMVVQMEALSERLAETTNANQALQDGQDQFEQQRAVLAERLGLEDLGLIEENTQLRHQVQALTVEHQDLERQAAKTKSYLEQQVQALETSTEEQISGARRQEEEARFRAEDLQRQVDAAKKMQSSHKQFLEQQSADREQEREEFQREIARLEEEMKLKEKPGQDLEELKKENQDLKDEISLSQSAATDSVSRIQQLEKEVSWKQDTVTELARQIKELERQLDDQKKLPARVSELEAELRGALHLQEEMRHEKEALQKQCYDQLLQISALQSKLDAHKHGLDSRVAPSTGASKSLDDTNEGPMSLAQQWEQDKEALDRNNKEIEDLVEQLEQFREDLTNKDEEIAQLNLQLGVASREQGSGREDMEEEISQVKAENERLKDELQAPPLDQEQSSLPRLAQELLEEKNLEIDQLEHQIQELQSSLDQQGTRSQQVRYQEKELVVEETIRVERRSAEAAPGSPDEDVKAEELNELRLELESQVASKDQEISMLRQQLGERDQSNALSNPAVQEVIDRMRQHTQDEEQQRKQLEQEVASLRQIMGIREREVAQLEAQLVRTQEQALSQGEEASQLDNNDLQKTIQEKELEIMNLKVEMDRIEEAAFQSQQQQQQARSPAEATPIPASPALEEALKTLEEELNQERSRASLMEADYQRRLAGLKGLSPGKTLGQKLNEIREELTRQHQQHVADIQHTMNKEAELRIEQIKKEHAHQIQLLDERTRTQVHEAVLKTNQDLLVAHGEEKARTEEEHRKQMERLAAATPINVSTLGEVGDLLHKEVENTARLDSNLLGHLRRRQGGVGREQPPGEGSMTNGDSSDLDMTNGNGEIPPRLQSVLARLHSDGLQVLSLSDLRYLRQATSPHPGARRGTDVASLRHAWENEKQALLDAIQAMKDLVTHTTTGLRNDELDWRGDLLRAIQAVFDQERESLLAELRTHVVASGDQDLSQVQLLERRIREQETHHKAAMEQIYGADRASLLTEVHDLRVNHNASRIELQEIRQRSTQQLSALEEQSSNREKQFKRQLETMEHKFRQERILADDLRTSLTVERQKISQLGASLSNEKKLVSELRDEIAELQALVDRLHSERDDFERRMTDIASVAESALAALEAEKARSATLMEGLDSEKGNISKLHEALSQESNRSVQARHRDQKLVKELRKELDVERVKANEMGKSLDAARERAESLSRELEAERDESANTVSSEKMRMFDLKRALDVEKTRCQEAHTALQRDRTLNAQLHETLEQERRSFADDSLRDKSAVSDLQNLLEGERRKANELHSTIQQLESQIGRLEGALHSQRSQGSDVVERERAINRKLKESLENLDAQCRDLNAKLAMSQETASKAQADRDRLHATLTGQKELQLDEENTRETEREVEKQRQKEREKEREAEKQRQRDRELERQLDKQKMDAQEDELIETQRLVKRLERENKRIQETQADDDLHRAIEKELHNESGSPQRRREGRVGKMERASLDLYKGQLESVRQRLQLMAVKQQEELSKIERATMFTDSVPSSSVQELRSVDGALVELITELRQVHAALALLSESQPPLVTSTASRINERLLEQNAEMSSYVSQLSTEKSELRAALSKLEEEIWQYRQREVQRHRSPRGASSDKDTEALLARERATWAQECLATQSSLQEAERQIIQLKLDLERGTLRREHVNGETTEQQQQQKIQRLYGKYLRAESFRKALVYQKKYLLLLLGGFQDCEQATLSLIAKMGAYPSPEDLRDHPSKHGKGFTRFRSAARVVIAVSRLKFLVRKWRRATRSGSRDLMASANAPPSASQPDRTSAAPPSAAPPSTSTNQSPSTQTYPTGAQRYTSPLRGSPRSGEYSGDSPPVRDRGAYGLINGMAHVGATGGYLPGRTRPITSPLSHSRTGAGSHLGATPGSTHSTDRLGIGATPGTLNESDGSFYIRKIEALQERLGTLAGRKTTIGREQSSSSSRYSYVKR
ncbi:A-kinase anchor protein 9 isoform X6 [Strongylocentrotus purpuratus]|uniref:ELK domain-containing protein n=1 Tax=Strongylocentrotus purpuratus TaxID=7668 RepID=A0A7M7P624_STRPU|nr:A-kinase anchor protein 9 isoform X6 [Strongylocentrotus purpuratus]